MLKVLDLFSGIGGFSLGLERTGGFETVAFCEIEEFPRRVLAKHWPKVPCYHDVRELTADRLAADGIAVDVITGGFPCQDLSAAGKRGGISAGRSGLWSEIVRLAGEIRPHYIVVENVTNLLAGERGAWFATVLSDLAAVGYDAEWNCIQAANIGLPHGRDRVWILAYPTGERWGCLVKGQQIQSARLYNESLARRAPNPLRILPDVARMVAGADGPIERNDDGLSEGLDRLKGLGNAVVPQIPELIGRAILASMASAPVTFDDRVHGSVDSNAR
jgi:DNA (cytosine-5)-methyltransferase 1